MLRADDPFLEGAIRNLIREETDRLGILIRQLQRRMMYGLVTSAGAIDSAGSGDWTVAKTATGKYTVTPNRAFSAVPTMLVTLAQGSLYFALYNKPGSSTTALKVEVYTTAGAAQDAPFGFVALESR